MSLSISTVPIRAAVFPKSYLLVSSRGYASLLATTSLRYSNGSLLATKPGYHRTTKRFISSTPQQQIKEFFPPPNTPQIKESETAWVHPVYTEEQMRQVEIAHREAKNWSDWVALGTVRMLRWGMDLVTGYRHPPPGKENDVRFRMTEQKWLTRFVFLESVAGVPGMVGGMLRHLRSLRRMKRDNGWIETLLEEAFNERMHLLTFLKLAEPGWFMRLMVLGAQGVFFNGFFLSYLVSPRTCHRFVGYLEEEAVITYTRAIKDLENGNLPLWEKKEAPEIAIQYWKMPEGKRTMKDLLLYVRADEAKHREVNHTLGNLSQAADPNPYTSKYKDPSKPHPSKGMENLKPTGWERDDVI
ncbi:alternative oxidase, mitochondrial precursor [Aspergillus terreus NIH2624]|uniref:Alternative oxidase n=1 Tax=Aspergillus terreus (strain NIH 2624 / FGSC A1156) TaxID=341663 RepID=Q0CJY5_ASPTN|nr:alternative oxidase, mitochondrial precursor [Aspergillus terreus NIH2624]EAU33760.1 alternative oxidase, mitochondrial precursor [Aspergillus terreus NIH2624]WQY90904.1 mitochondrial alternative oxidase [Aspergillus terreus]